MQGFKFQGPTVVSSAHVASGLGEAGTAIPWTQMAQGSGADMAWAPQSFWLLLGPEEPLDKVSFENPRRLNDGITVHGKLLFLPFCKKKQGYAPDK